MHPFFLSASGLSVLEVLLGGALASGDATGLFLGFGVDKSGVLFLGVRLSVVYVLFCNSSGGFALSVCGVSMMNFGCGGGSVVVVVVISLVVSGCMVCMWFSSESCGLVSESGDVLNGFCWDGISIITEISGGSKGVMF